MGLAALAPWQLYVELADLSPSNWGGREKEEKNEQNELTYGGVQDETSRESRIRHLAASRASAGGRTRSAAPLRGMRTEAERWWMLQSTSFHGYEAAEGALNAAWQAVGGAKRSEPRSPKRIIEC